MVFPQNKTNKTNPVYPNRLSNRNSHSAGNTSQGMIGQQRQTIPVSTALFFGYSAIFTDTNKKTGFRRFFKYCLKS
jgi:phage repressor protein C with HTH and peptisase S24 domain